MSTPRRKDSFAAAHLSRTRRRLSPLMALAVIGFLWAGCSSSNEPAPGENLLAAQESATLDHVHNELVLLDTPQAINQLFKQGVATFRQETPFRQVGFFYRADPDETLQWRVRLTDGKWSDWTPAEVTWQEEDLHVGRAILEHEALELELRGARDLSWAQVEFFDKIVANQDTLARDLPFAKPADDFAEFSAAGDRVDAPGFVTTRQKVAPRSLVIPRSEWGARSPNKVCGSTHNPYRMAIHHTVAPATDGGNAAAAMRGMQAYHMDNNGWCDIGYHFVVSQAGNIYQGRSSEKRIGAHVGGQNTGNIGICLIGNFQPGYSTTRSPSSTQLKAAGRIVGWVHDTYNVPLNRTSVKGHREHSGQTTSCPGTNLLNKISTILNHAKDSGTPDAEYDISVAVKWKGTQNFYTQGSSHNIADALPGDTFKAEIIIKNKSNDVIRNVWAGYQIDEPYIKATHYKIYTDHPAKDGSTWVINDADGADGNPARDGLGTGGKINLFAFSAGESKRILVDLKATQYSIGEINHPDVRGWIQHAEGRSGVIFGDKNSWGDTPGTNKLGHKARGYAQIDVLERDVWRFNDTDDDASLEGWTGEPEGHIAALKNNTSLGLLSLKVAGDDARLIAPAWTEINADQYDQMVLRLRSHAGPHTTAVFWAGDEQSFSADRSVRFEAPGDTEFNDLVIPLGSHADWKGTIKKLRIDPLDEAAPNPDDSAWYDIDELFFQSSTDQTTSAPGVDYVDATPVSLDNGETPDEPSEPEQPEPDPGNENPDPGDEQPEPDPGNGELNPDDTGQPRTVVNSGGCSVSSVSSLPAPGGIAWLLLATGGLLLFRRRQSTPQ